MKKKMLKLLVAVCCIAMLFTMFGTFAGAHEINTSKNHSNAHPVPKGYTWSPITSVTGIQKTAKYFVINTKVDTHDEALYISFPQEGGFRLQSKHEYQETVEVSNVGLFEPASLKAIDYKQDGSGAVMMSGTDGTIVRYLTFESGFMLEIYNASNKKIIYITHEQISFAYDRKGNVTRTMVEMPLVKKEAIYNGSERFTAANQVGYHYSLTNTDCWSYADYAYNNVPLFHSNRGYSIWFNMTYPGEADIGETNKEKYSIKFDGDKLDFYLWTGTPLENLKKYTSLTGTSGMSEEWTFGFWTGAMSAAFQNKKLQNAEANMQALFKMYKDKYNFYPEACYGEGTNSTTSGPLQYAKSRGIRMLCWFQPASNTSTMVNYLPLMAASTPRFDEQGNCISTGYPYIYNKSLLKYYNKYSFNGTWYDYSNPSTIDVTTNRLYQYWKWGLSGAMIDYGENLSFSGICFNGLSGMEMHNLNSYYYAMNSNKAWSEQWGNDYVLFERSGCAGSQYWSGNFLGDQKSTYAGYLAQVYAMISMGAGGFNLYGGDLGGLGGAPTNDLWNRWVVLSTFSPYMRQHGSVIHMAEDYGMTAEANFGKYYYLRKNMVPMIMDSAMDGSLNSDPIVKGMMMAYPNQLSLAQINNQYLFCDDFLVCAVESADQHTLEVQLPSNHTWYSLFTYEKFRGSNKKVVVEAPADFMPVFVQDGAVKAINLPESMKLMDEMHDAGDEDSEDQLPHASLLITPPDKARTTKIYTKQGKSEDYRNFQYTTETYTNTPADGSAFTLKNAEGSNRQTVLALGVCAAEITVDGEKMTRYDHMPDFYNEEYGYYVDLAGMTTILLEKGWKELTIVKGETGFNEIELEVYDKESAWRMIDDDVSTYTQVSDSRRFSTAVQVADEEGAEIGRIRIGWISSFANAYDLDYSEDGEDWETIYTDDSDKFTVDNGAGGVDIITFEPVQAKYIRYTTMESGDAMGTPGIYSFKAFAPDNFVEIDPEEEEEWDDEDEEEDEDEEDPWDEDEEEEDDDDDDKGKTKKTGKKKKYLITSYFPTWAIILIIGGAVIVATAIVLLILLLLKKKKKKAAEAELAAAEDSPTDFPNPPTN